MQAERDETTGDAQNHHGDGYTGTWNGGVAEIGQTGTNLLSTAKTAALITLTFVIGFVPTATANHSCIGGYCKFHSIDPSFFLRVIDNRIIRTSVHTELDDLNNFSAHGVFCAVSQI